MSHDETLVGSIALIVATVSLAIAVGPWNAPYQLRTVSSVSRRFGKPAARGLWMVIALASMTAGLAILSGLRPSYAVPAQRTQTDQ